MNDYIVYVTIENKPGIADPEGTTILHDLVLKGDFSSVSDVRTAKMLKFTIKDSDSDQAQKTIKTLCDRLRIYNPLVSVIDIRVKNA